MHSHAGAGLDEGGTQPGAEYYPRDSIQRRCNGAVRSTGGGEAYVAWAAFTIN